MSNKKDNAPKPNQDTPQDVRYSLFFLNQSLLVQEALATGSIEQSREFLRLFLKPQGLGGGGPDLFRKLIALAETSADNNNGESYYFHAADFYSKYPDTAFSLFTNRECKTWIETLGFNNSSKKPFKNHRIELCEWLEAEHRNDRLSVRSIAVGDIILRHTLDSGGNINTSLKDDQSLSPILIVTNSGIYDTQQLNTGSLSYKALSSKILIDRAKN